MSVNEPGNDWEAEWEAMLGTVPQLARDLREMSAPAEAGYRGLRTWIYSNRPDGSSRAIKELVMVVVNVAEGNSQGAVTHMRMGLENGLTRTQLAEALAQCFLSLGLIRFNTAGLAVWQASGKPAADR
jgi:alkylhydroperoxidase/carboxymuconolactone decarboxylase family protein YurZ